MKNLFILLLMMSSFMNSASACLYNFSTLKTFCDIAKADGKPVDGMGFTTCNGNQMAGCEWDSSTSCIPSPYSCCLYMPVQKEAYKLCPEGPTVAKAKEVHFPNEVSCTEGSVIYGEKQTLSERINLAGTPFQLVYSSEKVKGNKSWNYIRIPATSSSHTPGVISDIKLLIEVEGQETEISVTNSPNVFHNFIWDGKDGLGNTVPQDVYGAQYFLKYEYTDYPYSNTLYQPYQQLPYHDMVGTKLPSMHFGGWNLSINHFLDSSREVVFLGDGRSFKANKMEKPNGEIWVLSNFSSEMYVFDTTGKHLTTRNSLTGSDIYTFTYSSSNHLQKVEDAFSNEITLNYINSRISSIVAPRGQVTTFDLDSNGYIESVTNPESETYEMSYSTDGLLLTFEKPDGSSSTFS